MNVLAKKVGYLKKKNNPSLKLNEPPVGYKSFARNPKTHTTESTIAQTTKII